MATQISTCGSLKFVKVIPKSAAAPGYKLTLPHQIVNEHLQHLVNAYFDLASSPQATLTWHGYISPRRNKDRAEFILQGWKLFAEAHKFQAGDHILFELCSSWRLVARRVHNPGPPQKAAMTRKISDVVNSCIAPDKIHRGMDRSSPTSHKFLHWHQERNTGQAEQSFVSPYNEKTEPNSQSPPVEHRMIPLETGLERACKSEVQEGGQGQNSTGAASEGVEGDARMVQRVQSWLSLNCSSPSTASTRLHASNIVRGPASRSSEIQPPSPVKNPKPVQSTDEVVSLPGIFEDMDVPFEATLPDMPEFEDLFEDIQTSRSTSSVPIKEMNIQDSPRAMVNQSSNEYQECLERHTLKALKATISLEQNALDLASLQSDQRNTAQTQFLASMTGLKESLWQILILANGN